MDSENGTLVSGSLDEIIKIWGPNFEQLFVVELKSCKAINKLFASNKMPNPELR